MVIDSAAIKLRYEALSPVLDERGRRRFAAAEAVAAGRGGIAAVSKATGIARSTIGYGLQELRGTAPDGTTIAMPACLIVTIRDGRIARIHEYLDPSAVTALSR